MRKALLKIIFTFALLFLALSLADWDKLKESLASQQPYYVAVALMGVILQTICGGLRWHALRHAFGEHSTANHTAAIYYASSFFSLFAPSTLGSDMARVWLARRDAEPFRHIIYGVIVDRLMALFGLGLLVVATLPWLARYIGLAQGFGIAGTILCIIMITLAYVALRGLLNFLKRLMPFLFLKDMIEALIGMVGKHRALLASAGWALSAHLSYVVSAYALARGLNIEVSFIACATLVPLVLFLGTLPISFGGWGVRELTLPALLALAGVGYDEALAVSIQLGLLGTANFMLGGLVYLLLSPPRRRGSIRSE